MKDKVSISAIFVSVLSQSFLESWLRDKKSISEKFLLLCKYYSVQKSRNLFFSWLSWSR